MGKVIELFGKQELTPEIRAHLIQRIGEMTLDIVLLTSERDRLQGRLDNE